MRLQTIPFWSWETITGFTALWISVYLIILPILNFISVPNEIFVGICNLNLLISSIFTLILFRNILDFSNFKFSHFSDLYFMFHFDENMIIRTHYKWYIGHVQRSILKLWREVEISETGSIVYRISMIVTSSDGSEKGELYITKENIGRKLKDFILLMV